MGARTEETGHIFAKQISTGYRFFSKTEVLVEGKIMGVYVGQYVRIEESRPGIVQAIRKTAPYAPIEFLVTCDPCMPTPEIFAISADRIRPVEQKPGCSKGALCKGPNSYLGSVAPAEDFEYAPGGGGVGGDMRVGGICASGCCLEWPQKPVVQRPETETGTTSRTHKQNFPKKSLVSIKEEDDSFLVMKFNSPDIHASIEVLEDELQVSWEWKFDQVPILVQAGVGSQELFESCHTRSSFKWKKSFPLRSAKLALKDDWAWITEIRDDQQWVGYRIRKISNPMRQFLAF